MKNFIVLFFVFAACSAKKQNQESIAISEPVTALAELTETQKAEGWKLLFDGKTLNGWQNFKGRKNNTWEVRDGFLHCKPLNEKVKDDGDERGDIMTTEEFENFEFSCDWKISAEGNSGIIYLVTEEFDQPYYSGPEYQILDDMGYKPQQKDIHLSGADYGMYAPAPKNLKPVGEWNSAKIVVNNKHVEHWLNGQKIVEYEMGSPTWLKRKEASNWKDAKGYGKSAKGHIDLQDHGHEVWFKNVMIKTL